MKKSYLFASVVLLAASPAFAQTKIGAPGAPDSSAMLEITSGTSGNKGLLLPRMTLTQRNAIPAPATGLMIYNTTANQVQVNTGTPVVPIWVIATATNSGWDLVGNSGTTPATNFIGTTDNQPLVVRTNNTEKLRVTAAGNLGVGTNAPATKVQVSGGAIRVENNTSISTPAIQIINDGGGGGAGDNLVIESYGPSALPSFSSAKSRGTRSAPQNLQTGDVIGNLYASGQVNGGQSNLNLIRSTYTGNGTTVRSTMDFSTSNAVAATIDADGNLGLGTGTPAQTLHVAGTARISTAVGTPTTITGRNAAGDIGNVTLGSGLAITGGVLNTTVDNADWNLIGNTGTNPATNFIGTGDAQPLVIRTSNVEQLRVTAAGDVGIGTTAPAQSLHVQGTARIATAVGTPNTITGRNAAGDVGNVALGSGLALTGGVLNTTADNADWNLIGNTGTNPATNFIGTSDNQPLVVRTNNTEKMRVTSAGNLGIGNTAPIFTLDVGGGIRLQRDTLLASNGGASILWNSVNSGGGETEFINYHGTGVGGFRFYNLAPGTTPGSAVGELVRITGNGAVGIGTGAPAQTLHVAGTARIATAVGTPTTVTGRNAAGDVGNVTLGSGLAITGGVLNTTADNADWNLIGNTGTNPATNFIGTADAQPLVIRTSNVEQLRVTAAGDVGIGTTAPAQSLHVQGTARIATAVGTPNTITGRNAAGDVGNVALGSGLALTGGVLNTTVDNADWNLIGNTGTNPATNFIGTGDAQPLVIRTNNTEKVRITTGGNVGINNTAPLSPLSFASAIGPKITFWNGGSTTNHFGIGVSNDQLNYHVTQGSTHTFYAGGTNGDGTELMRIQSNGSVGIGTIAPAQTLHVQGTARIATAVGTPTTVTGRNAAGDVGNVTLGSGLAITGGVLNTTADNADWNLIGNTGTNPATNFIGTGDAQPLVIRTSNVEQLRVTAAGDVGIGTTAPAQSLHVQGTARISTAVGTPNTITGRNAAGDVGNVTVGSGLTLTAGVLTASGGTAGWGLTGNSGTNPATNFIGTNDNQSLAIRTNNTEQVRVTSTGSVGIGTQNPSSKLAVNEGAINVTTTATISSAAIEIINNGGGPLFNDDIRIASYGTNTSPALNLFSARGTVAAPLNAQAGDVLGAINATAQINGSQDNLANIRMIYMGDGITKQTRINFNSGAGNSDMSIDSSGFVGIGTLNPTARLSVNGAANNTTGTWSIFSDARVKTVDGEYEDGLATVMKIHPVKFHYNANAPFKSAEQQIGIIAQEMEQIAPYMVSKVNADGFADLRQYNNQALPYMLVNAIREQQAQIEVLKAKNEQLEAANKVTAQLMERVKQMEQMMGINEIEGTSKVAGK